MHKMISMGKCAARAALARQLEYSRCGFDAYCHVAAAEQRAERGEVTGNPVDEHTGRRLAYRDIPIAHEPIECAVRKLLIVWGDQASGFQSNHGIGIGRETANETLPVRVWLRGELSRSRDRESPRARSR